MVDDGVAGGADGHDRVLRPLRSLVLPADRLCSGCGTGLLCALLCWRDSSSGVTGSPGSPGGYRVDQSSAADRLLRPLPLSDSCPAMSQVITLRPWC
jgi:hypothetical protein